MVDLNQRCVTAFQDLVEARVNSHRRHRKARPGNYRAIGINDRNLLFSGEAAEVGVLGGGVKAVSVDRVI